MKVERLSDDEMHELKDTLYTDFYYNQEALPHMIESERDALASATYPTDIPNWLMYSLYSGTEFTEDDFWCNL